MLNLLVTVAGVFDIGILQGLVFAGLAFSVLLSLLSLDFPDLGIEGTFPAGAAVAAILLSHGITPLLVFPAAAIAGGLGGLLTATLHVRFGMSKLLSGICTATIFYTINIWVMGNRPNIPVLTGPTVFSWCEKLDGRLKHLLYPDQGCFFHPASILGCVLLIGVVKVALDFVLNSEFGVALRAVGQNERAVRYFGRSPAGYKLVGLALANACAAVAGAIAAQYQGFSDVHMGAGALVLALVSVILGQELFARLGLSTSAPKFRTWAALVGIILYQTILAGVLRSGAPPTSLRLIAGIALIIVIAMRQRRKALAFSW